MVFDECVMLVFTFIGLHVQLGAYFQVENKIIGLQFLFVEYSFLYFFMHFLCKCNIQQQQQQEEEKTMFKHSVGIVSVNSNKLHNFATALMHAKFLVVVAFYRIAYICFQSVTIDFMRFAHVRAYAVHKTIVKIAHMVEESSIFIVYLFHTCLVLLLLTDIK